MMWRDPPNPADGGEVMFYTYHPDKPGDWGDNMLWDDGPSGQVHFQRGEWHLIEHRVVMNTPGEHDGILEGWFDGEKAFERTDLRFRDTDDLAIDDCYFSLFFGGDQNEEWAHDREEHVQFDDLVVSTEPIWLDDDEPPAAPTELTASARSETSLDIAWTGSAEAGPSGVDHYRVYQNDRLREQVPAGTTEVLLNRVISGEEHEFAVEAVDLAGNVSDPATVTLTMEPTDRDGPPNTPGGFEQVDRQLDWIAVEWRPLDQPDDPYAWDLSHYQVLVDGTVAREVPHDEGSARLTDLMPGESYEVSLRAVGLEGGYSEPTTIQAHTVPAVPADALVLNSFDDGLWPGQNQVGEWAGGDDFENGEGEVVTAADGADVIGEGALRLEYDDSGWLRSRLDGHDVSEYDQLTLLVSGDAGGEEHHAEVEVGDAGGVLADLTDDVVRTEPTAVRIDLEDAGVVDEPPYVYASFTEGSAGAVTIHQIRFDHVGATGGDGGTDEDPCEAVGAEAGEELVNGEWVCDLDGDGNYRDLTASGETSVQDLQHFFANQHTEPYDSRTDLFDFTDNGDVGQPDVVDLFHEL